MSIGIESELRKAEKRAREQQKISDAVSGKVRQEFTSRMSPIVSRLKQIKREGYLVRNLDGSLKPFDYSYEQGNSTCEALLGKWRAEFHLGTSDSGYDSYEVTLYGNDKNILEQATSTNLEVWEKLMDWALKYNFFVKP